MDECLNFGQTSQLTLETYLIGSYCA